VDRRTTLGLALAGVVVVGALALLASRVAPGDAPPVRFWMRDDDDTRVWDRPDGSVVARVDFAPHRFDDAGNGATLRIRPPWWEAPLERLGFPPPRGAQWTAEYVTTDRPGGVAWHRFVRVSGIEDEVAPDAALVGTWRWEDGIGGAPATWTLAADGTARRSDVPILTGLWGARDGAVCFLWSGGGSGAPLDIGVVSDDGRSMRGVGGTRWRAQR
jgi:hypothetical protein